MRALLLLALLALPANAQRIRLEGPSTSGGGGIPDPSRNDVAVSYRATGPNGLQTTPQASPSALGDCATLNGAYVSAIPPGETDSRPYYCNGIDWSRIWTAADGTVANADVIVPGYSFVAQAPADSYAFRVSNNFARVDFGAGSADYFYSDGSQVYSVGSMQIGANQSLTVDIIGSTSGGLLQLFPGSWVIYQGVGSVAGCAGGLFAGGVIRLAGDQRLYYCDGTLALRLTRSLVASATVDPATILPSTCATQTMTVTGVATTDVGAVVTPGAALSTGLILVNERVSASDTVSFDLCNYTTLSSVDQPSTTFTASVNR